MTHIKYFFIFGFVVQFRIERYITRPIWMIGSLDIRGNVFLKCWNPSKLLLKSKKALFSSVQVVFRVFLANQWENSKIFFHIRNPETISDFLSYRSSNSMRGIRSYILACFQKLHRVNSAIISISILGKDPWTLKLFDSLACFLCKTCFRGPLSYLVKEVIELLDPFLYRDILVYFLIGKKL